MRGVLSFIEAHLHEELSGERLSRVAGFSRFHFHRRFRARYGLGVAAYVRRLRLKRGLYFLLFRELRVLEVALRCGYASHEAFTRACQRAFDQSPRSLRQGPRWANLADRLAPMTALRRRDMPVEYRLEDIDVVELPDRPAGVLSYQGDPRRIGEALRRFIAWRNENGLPPRRSGTFNVCYGDPDAKPPEAFRIDLCAVTARPIQDNPYGVESGCVPGGRYAALLHRGSDDGIDASLRFISERWLPSSGEAHRKAPLLFERLRFFPEVPEAEAETRLYFPLT